MTEYLITFNDEWVPDHTAEELREKATAAGVVPRLAARGSAALRDRRPHLCLPHVAPRYRRTSWTRTSSHRLPDGNVICWP